MWDVIIVGAGSTGLTAANLLGQAGIKTLLLERNTGLSDTPRAITIDDEGLRICQSLDLDAAIQHGLLLNVPAQYRSRGRLLAHIAPREQLNGHPLISTLHQPSFEAALLTGVRRFACVEVRFQHAVEAMQQDELGVHLQVRAVDDILITLSGRYVLACDGGRSTLRQCLGISFYPVRWHDLRATAHPRAHQKTVQKQRVTQGQRWLVVDCAPSVQPPQTITFFCNPARPAVTVPAPQSRQRWEFMLFPHEREADVLDEGYVTKLIKQTQATLPAHAQPPDEPLAITRQAIYTFHARLASRFLQGRVFLLGDAAHLMPPFGGQGMNSGLRDAANLCWKLQRVLQGQADPRLLDSYGQERRPHTAQMIIFSALLGKLIMPTARPVAGLRDLFFRGISHLPPLRHQLTEMRVKPQARYTRGCVLPILCPEGRRLTGTLLPQPCVQLSDGTRLLLDEALGNDFSLIRLYEGQASTDVLQAERAWQRLSIRSVWIAKARTGSATFNTTIISVVDVEGTLWRWLRNNRTVAVLVRPDRYVMAVCRTEQLGQLYTMIQHSPGFSAVPGMSAPGSS